jgi:hypothetical protein
MLWSMNAGGLVAAAATIIGMSAAVPAQTVGSEAPLALIDSTGKRAATPLGDAVVLVRVTADVRAPAFIRPIYDAEGRTASGLATWAGGGSVLFTSADCTTGPFVHTLVNPGLRAASQVETPQGTMLYAGVIGAPTTIEVRSILYPTGCAALRIRENGLVPVVASVNLTTAYPPPLSLQ